MSVHAHTQRNGTAHDGRISQPDRGTTTRQGHGGFGTGSGRNSGVELVTTPGIFSHLVDAYTRHTKRQTRAPAEIAARSQGRSSKQCALGEDERALERVVAVVAVVIWIAWAHTYQADQKCEQQA